VKENNIVVLGAGMTGLGAGLSALPVYEAAEEPGGICSSYYMRPGGTKRLPAVPSDGNAYRFEIGGGHWIFGGDPLVLRLIDSITPVRRYERKSAVWLPTLEKLVPYPLQNHLRCLGPELGSKCLQEMVEGLSKQGKPVTMADWLKRNFGTTLCDLFFAPFHELYTAGLWEKIAPQDGYKSPLDLSAVLRGALSTAAAAGYNTTFVYPKEGLNALAQRMAAGSDVRYGKRAVSIEPADKEVYFEDGSRVGYDVLLSTLPLNKMVEMIGLRTGAIPDPSPSVLVLNIGAEKGTECPEEHWIYVPSSKARFHRVGFYSNVDHSFLPRGATDRVSIYVEKAYGEGEKPDPDTVSKFCSTAIKELQNWNWIGEVDAMDPTWIEVAYTWSWAGSQWKREALSLLETNGIYQVGRYARWVFQGIADSIRDGLTASAAMIGTRSVAVDDTLAATPAD
jgi:protoporphyrinogen oxidase